MPEIIASVASPAWWFSAILIALLVNLVSAYAKPWTDNVLSRISVSWGNRTARDREQFRAAVAILVESQQELAAAFENEVRSRLRNIVFLLFVVMFILFSIELTKALSSLDRSSLTLLCVGGVKVAPLFFMVFARTEHRNAMRKSSELRAARRILAEESGASRDAHPIN